MLSASIEDYIKAIYALEAEHARATTKEIAERLEVKMASVTGMMKHLAAEGYVKHTPYKGVQLTAQGRQVALGMIRRHRLIELFLSQTLGLSWDAVHADAEQLEHVVSDHLVERMYDYLGRPEFDPHGSPIPAKDGTIAPPRGVRLDKMDVGALGEIVEVSDRDPSFLRYLTDLGLGIGTKFEIKDRAPFNGPIQLAVGQRQVAIGHEAGSRIRAAPSPLDPANETQRLRRKRPKS
jgi:DtxR family transcriptional regulator, Mn-dependent transcriptional regulator